MKEILINLAFNTQKMDYIFNVLSQRPYAEVAPIIADIQQQIAMQQQAPVEVPAAAPRPNGKNGEPNSTPPDVAKGH
jgi:hypothetical protein